MCILLAEEGVAVGVSSINGRGRGFWYKQKLKKPYIFQDVHITVVVYGRVWVLYSWCVQY